MSKVEAISEVLKSKNGPVIAGIGGIGLLVGGHMLMDNHYKAEVKSGDKTATLAPVDKEREA